LTREFSPKKATASAAAGAMPAACPTDLLDIRDEAFKSGEKADA
jgi:hypothetical protein